MNPLKSRRTVKYPAWPNIYHNQRYSTPSNPIVSVCAPEVVFEDRAKWEPCKANGVPFRPIYSIHRAPRKSMQVCILTIFLERISFSIFFLSVLLRFSLHLSKISPSIASPSRIRQERSEVQCFYWLETFTTSKFTSAPAFLSCSS